jgi:hypothetical protein
MADNYLLTRRREQGGQVRQYKRTVFSKGSACLCITGQPTLQA